MFTGIVETVGTVSALKTHDETDSGGRGCSLTITDCAVILTDARLGDSISIDGTCLTITALSPHSPSTAPVPPTMFKVGIAPETLRRTTLNRLHPSSRCNLERAVSASTRMGGHFLQGHVDTVAEIINITPDGNSLRYRLRPREEGVLRYVVEKGYVGLDGASLTVTRVCDGLGDTQFEAGTGRAGEESGKGGWFEVMLIAYTQERVVMGVKGVGEVVNVEVDMVGKYVEKSLRGYFEGLEKSHADDGNGSKEVGVLERMVERMVDRRIAARVGG